MAKKQKEELIPVIVRVPKSKKEKLQKVAARQGKHEADIVRSGIDKEINIQIYKDNIDLIVKELDSMIDAKLDFFINSQRKINAKFLRTSAINTYLQGEVFKRLLGDEMYKEFIGMLNSARRKANYYINHNADDLNEKDLYDFYSIDEGYRNE